FPSFPTFALPTEQLFVASSRTRVPYVIYTHRARIREQFASRRKNILDKMADYLKFVITLNTFSNPPD
ncbi:MAG: hypothetical protein J1F25_06845, partial [Prevotellaceae bacterium]|nr:hypothetical protein [Prevotellaceae bacterium]